MKHGLIYTLILISVVNIKCQEDSRNQKNNEAIPIGENAFVYKDKVYKLINNELLQICDLKETNIRKLEISSPKLKDLGTRSLDFIKKGAYSIINTVYRGNYLYFKLKLDSINDLKESYFPGKFTVTFLDEFNFAIYTIDISTEDLIGSVDESGKIAEYKFNGKIEISLDAQASITDYGISAAIKHK